jgi:uncharacterized protein
MAFSNEISDKKLLIKTIQTLNQHLPAKRLYLSDLLKMEKPGIKGKDNTFFVIDRSELELISQSLPRFMWSKLRLPLLIEMAPDFGSNSARIQGEAEVEVVCKILKKGKPDKKYLVIYIPEIRELRRILPTATQYAFLASIREDIEE